jgi:hypothetical protein
MLPYLCYTGVRDSGPKEQPIMAYNPTTGEILATILQLPLEDRELLFNALQESLIDDSIDHGPAEPHDEVQAAWGEEIARRIADIESGRVKTISSEDAWKIIDGETSPKL